MQKQTKIIRATLLIAFIWVSIHGGCFLLSQREYFDLFLRFAPYLSLVMLFEVYMLRAKERPNGAYIYGLTLSGILILLLDIIVILQIFYIPNSSTAGLAMIYLPTYQLAAVPIGFVSGYIMWSVFKR